MPDRRGVCLSGGGPLCTYFQPFVTYNSVFLNAGSWTSSIPGWLSPNGHMLPEPLLWTGVGLRQSGSSAFASWAALTMRKTQERWPTAGASG